MFSMQFKSQLFPRHGSNFIPLSSSNNLTNIRKKQQQKRQVKDDYVEADITFQHISRFFLQSWAT